MSEDATAKIEVVSLLPGELGSTKAEDALKLLKTAFTQQEGASEASLVFAQATLGEQVAQSYVDFQLFRGLLDETRVSVSSRLTTNPGIHSVGIEAVKNALAKLNKNRQGINYSVSSGEEYGFVVSSGETKIEFMIGKQSTDDPEMIELPTDNSIIGTVFFDGTNVGLPLQSILDNNDPNIQLIAAKVPDIIALAGKATEALNFGLGGSEKSVLGWNTPNPEGSFSIDYNGSIYTPKGIKIGFIK